ncbi:MAG: hypothetical protein CM1200mP20_09500 [Pseudomonadota bacterium]|nr:MAG: hypothetical protein CM1200mP20_09500 [Pseudomonadota bacterium]
MSSNCQTILPTGSTGTHRRPACTSGLIETTSLHNLRSTPDSCPHLFKVPITGYDSDLTLKETLAISCLEGHGVEFGPLNNPLPVNPEKATLVYADRLSKEEALALFPELRDIAQNIVEPDLIVDFNDLQALTALGNHEFDFIIANHFIEHLVNPIQFSRGLQYDTERGR